ncbi:MAG TPA: hypothetical protein VFQ23_05940 [Anaerolineales bacterium]|nr:hypothetical protein [Anaerolineales bacterium]
MDVKIKPLSGCLQIVLGVLTLGIAPLAAWLNERAWPKSVDEQGLTTRAGTNIAWGDFTKIKKVITKIGQTSTTTEHYELSGPNGKVVVAPYRLENGNQVFDFIWRRLPERIKQPQN